MAADASPGGASTKKAAPRRKAGRTERKGLLVPALIVLVMFAGAGAVVWQVVPQYLASSAKVAVADPSAAVPTSDTAPLPPAKPAEPETLAAAPAASEPAPPPEVAPEPAAPVQAAPEPAPKPAAAEPAAAAGVSPEEADWVAAREVGNIAAFRTYMLKWPEGKRRDQALSAAKRRIKTLSTKPESLSIRLSGPVAYRELPTFRDKGAAEGAAGQTINFVDRIASPIEGEWLVLEREGAWPLRFVSVRDIEAGKQ